MDDKDKSKKQLTKELGQLRRRVTELEAFETRHIAAETALKKAEEEKQTILDSLVEHVVYHDFEMRVLWANRAACDSAGMTREALLGRHCYEIWAKRSDPCEDCPVNSARETGQPHALEKTTPDGRFWYIQGSPVRDSKGHLVGMVELTLDITQRKRTEEELRESEARYRQLVEAMNEALGFADGNYIFTFVNRKFCEMLGYSQDELIGRHLIEFIHGDYRELMKNQMARRRKGEEDRFELAWRTKDGRKVYTIASPKSIFDAEGNFAGSLAVLTDITVRRQLEEALRKAQLRAREEIEKLVEERTAELVASNSQLRQEIEQRKQAEEALRESEEDYRMLVETMNEGLSILDENMEISYVNTRFCEMLGYSRDEMIGRSIAFLLEGINLRILREQFERQRKGERNSYEIAFSGKGTEKVFAIVSPRPILDADGRFAGSFAVITDITQRKRAEQALRESEEFASSLLKYSPNPILVLNPDTSVKYINPAFEGLTGFAYAEILGLKTPYPWWPKEASETITSDLDDALAEGAVRLEESFRKKNGEQFCVEITGKPVRKNGRLNYYLSTWVDITERKRAEENIRGLSQELITAQEVERQRLAADLHDHLAQDLASLKIGLYTLNADQPGMPDEMRQRVSELSELLEHSIVAVRDMAYGLHPASLSEFGLVYAARQYCEEFARKNGLQLDFFSVGMDDLKLDFDTKITLYRLIQEGLTNIQKHADASHVNVKLSASVSHIRLHIEDNGKGFEANNRLKAALSERRLGIWGMEQRAAFLKGEMKIESAPMDGTKIVIRIPHMDRING